MRVELKPFMTLIGRLRKCKFKTVYMVNHLFIQCYDIAIDSDIGFHYVLAVPPTEEYDSEFYDMIMEINPEVIATAYRDGHAILLEKKKSENGKPKDVNEELYVQEKDGGLEFKFMYYFKEDLVTTKSTMVKYPLDETLSTAENIPNTLLKIVDRIRPGGSCVLIDAMRMGIYRRTIESPGIYYHNIKVNGKVVHLPFLKTMFNGCKETDTIYISVQETVLKDIYLMCIQLNRDDIIEEFFGYVQNF